MDEEQAVGALLACRNLRVWLNGHEILSGVNLSIPQNAVVAVLGESGSGKTTLLRALNRTNELLAKARTEGEVLFDGQDIYSPEQDTRLLRQAVGMVFPEPALFTMSILQNLAYAAQLRGVRSQSRIDDIAEEALHTVGLWEEVKTSLRASPKTLDISQRQRLCIARALCTSPRALLLDDPCLLLGGVGAMEVEQTIENLRGRVTMVIATRNTKLAARVSDSCALLAEGRIVEFAPTEPFFARPEHPQTERFITGRSL